jgi:hypothetical protein
MSRDERRQNSLQKFNIAFAVAMLIALFLFANSSILFSQTFQEVNFPEPSINVMSSKLEAASTNFKIYQSAFNVIKIELPGKSNAKVSLYDSKSNLIRTYIYNDLPKGSFEINLNTANLQKGVYTGVLNISDVQESTQIIIE